MKSGIQVNVIVSISGGSIKTRCFNSRRDAALDLVDVLCATCAIPFVFAAVDINGVQYIDGLMNGGFNGIRKCRDMLLIANSTPPIVFDSAWRVWEHLYKQSRNLQMASFSFSKILTPPRNSLRLFHVNARTLEGMFYEGCAIAAAECMIHTEEFPLPVARMACCGITVNAVCHELPSIFEYYGLIEVLLRGGVNVFHSRVSYPKTTFCTCMGPLVWSEPRTDGHS